MSENAYKDVVGLQIGEWVVCMGCVTNYLLRDAKEENLVREKDIRGHGIRCIRCEREIGAEEKTTD